MGSFLDPSLANHQDHRYEGGVFRRGSETLRRAMEQQGCRRGLCRCDTFSGHPRDPCSHEKLSANSSSGSLYVVPRFLRRTAYRRTAAFQLAAELGHRTSKRFNQVHRRCMGLSSQQSGPLGAQRRRSRGAKLYPESRPRPLRPDSVRTALSLQVRPTAALTHEPLE